MSAPDYHDRRPTSPSALLLLILAGAALEATYLALWVFGYPISQAADWSVAYLTQHQTLWGIFKPFLEAAQARWPTQMTETETLKSWTMALVMMGIAGLPIVWGLTQLLPLV